MRAMPILLMLAASALLAPGAIAQKDNRPQLVYDGHSFQVWNERLRTELKPAKLLESLKAMRLFAARGYAVEASTTVVEVMSALTLDVLGQDDFDTLNEAARKVIDVAAEEAHPVLLSALNGSDKKKRRYALDLLEQHFVQEAYAIDFAIAALHKLALGKDEDLGEEAIKLLASNREAKGAKAALDRLLRDSNEKQCIAVIAALEEHVSDDDFLSMVFRALSNPAQAVRGAAAGVLGSESIQWMFGINPGGNFPRSIKPERGERADQVQQKLTALLKDSSLEVRITAILSLERLKSVPPEAVSALLSFLRQGSVESRLQAVKLLKAYDGVHAVAVAFEQLLTDKDLAPSIRKAVLPSQIHRPGVPSSLPSDYRGNREGVSSPGLPATIPQPETLPPGAATIIVNPAEIRFPTEEEIFQRPGEQKRK